MGKRWQFIDGASWRQWASRGVGRQDDGESGKHHHLAQHRHDSEIWDTMSPVIVSQSHEHVTHSILTDVIR